MRAYARIGVASLVVVGLLCLRQLHQSFLIERSIRSSDAKKALADLIRDQHVEPNDTNIAKFLGIDLGVATEKSRRSSVVHCVGDNFLPKTASGYRSCQFRHICWDFDQNDFVIFESPQHQLTASLLKNRGSSKYIRTSFDFNTTVAISGTTENRLRQGIDGTWFPRKLPMDPTKKFYELPADVVMVPVNLPHDGNASMKDILFDFYLPLYNLLAMFDLKDKRLLLVNLGSSCTPWDSHSCFSGAFQVLPLMNSVAKMNETFMSLKDRVVTPAGVTTSFYSNLMCAKYGAAGIGALTDHGIHKGHGQRRKDYTFVRNNGRGHLLFEFRNYLLRNAGVEGDTHDLSSAKRPLKVIIAIGESKKTRVQYFQEQIKAVKASFASNHLLVESKNMLDMPFMEQVKIAAETSIYVSLMGDGAYPAFFLPRGATLILFYNDSGEFVSVSKRETTFPIKADYDLWNNLGYIRVHWLPLSTKDQREDLHTMVNLIEDVIMRKLPMSRQSSNDIDNAKMTTQRDGTFNGMNVTLVQHTDSSWSHCIGDNFQDEAYALRSCHFHHLCLDLELPPRNFSLVRSSHQAQLVKSIDKTAFISTNMILPVTLGQTIRFHEGSGWFPAISATPPESYYSLSNDIVWLPFYADQPNIHNPGHLLWDFFLPLYNLLVIFGLEENQVLVSNVDEACNKSEDNPCWRMVTKFLPLLGVNPNTFRNTNDSELRLQTPQRSSLVCAKNSVAGIGMLTDHGWNRHGQRIEDYRDSHNVGRGPLFYAFRNYMIHNMGIEESGKRRPPHKIIFSILSSKNPSRRLSFKNQIASLREAFSDKEITVEGHVLAEMSLKEQVKLAAEASVFVSVVGGSACIGTFLPRGSSMILFFNDKDEFVDHASRMDFPQMIDWDFWNNASYLRVHWLPISAISGKEAESSDQVLNEIIRSDIEHNLNE